MLSKKRPKPEKEEEKKREPIVLIFKSEKECNSNWKEVCGAFKKENPDLNIIYSRFKTNLGHIVVIPESDEDIKFKDEFTYEDTEFTVEICEGEDLINFYKEHGQHYEDCVAMKNKRNKKGKKESKNKNKNKKKEKKEKEENKVRNEFYKYWDSEFTKLERDNERLIKRREEEERKQQLLKQKIYLDRLKREKENEEEKKADKENEFINQLRKIQNDAKVKSGIKDKSKERRSKKKKKKNVNKSASQKKELIKSNKRYYCSGFNMYKEILSNKQRNASAKH